MKKGAKLLAADNDELNRAIKASELQTVNLFFVSKYLMGAPVSFNPNIVSIAESTEEFPGIERGKDYLFHAKELLETSSMQVHFAKGYSTEKVGGQDFDVLEARLTAMGKSIKQKYYARIIKGYALNFILTYTTDDELAGLQEVLNTVKFKQPN
jgi:hypothetical protein